VVRVVASLLLSLALSFSVGACVQPGLREPLFVGVEPVRNSDPRVVDLTARLIADFAAMPNIRVVDLGSARNEYEFASLSARKARLSPSFETGAYCLRGRYAVSAFGQLLYSGQTAVMREPGVNDLGCIDLFATAFYGDLVRRGL
jgi:hypothetical protein